MTDWVGRDPRGRTVVLQGKTWTRHIAPKHGDELGGKVLEIFRTLTDPDRILNNVRTPTARERVAGERYVRFNQDLGAHIIVPAIELEEDLITEGSGTVPAGSMKAITAYLSSDPPVARVLWNKKTNV